MVMKKKWIAACIAGLMVIGASTSSLALTPWSKVSGRFIGADGKTLQGALEKGVSISKYQNRAGEINWKRLLLQDVTFAMVRFGYYEEQDPYFDTNMKNAASHGIKTGVTFYSDAMTKEEIEKEARYLLDIIKDYQVSYPVALNMETEYLSDKGLSKKTITELVNAFCKVMGDAGYSPVVYGDYEHLTKYMDNEQMPYDVWYARYGVGDKFRNRTLWQCTDGAKLDGIKGLVCLEFAFEDYEQMFSGTEWREINDNLYYFQDYRMVKNTVIDIEGERYWFDKDGLTIRSESID